MGVESGTIGHQTPARGGLDLAFMLQYQCQLKATFSLAPYTWVFLSLHTNRSRRTFINAMSEDLSKTTSSADLVSDNQKRGLPPLYSPLPMTEDGAGDTEDEDLARKRSFIRLLTILPGKEANTVECELQVVRLSDAPPYEALSYVWGNPEPVDYVICNRHKKAVTQSLGSALKRLRYEDKTRLIWIDALCVNQEDLIERSQQVRLMRDSYSQPRQVVVWLGDDEGNQAEAAIGVISKAAVYWCAEMGKDFDKMTIQDLGSNRTEDRDAKAKSSRDIPYRDWNNNWKTSEDARKWDAVIWLYSNPWFTRVWVIQEVMFAPVTVYLGDRELSWINIAIAAQFLFYKKYASGTAELTALQHVQKITNFGRMVGGIRYLDLMGIFDSEASDPRDQLFALHSLAWPDDQRNPKWRPDYTKDVRTLYMENTREIAEHGGLPDVYAARSDPYVETEQLEVTISFPSWVIRWDRPSYTNIQDLIPLADNYTTCGRTAQLVDEMHDPEILSLRGFTISNLSLVDHSLHQGTNMMHDIPSLWLRVQSEILGGSVSYKGADTLDHAFAQTVTALTVGKEWPAGQELSTLMYWIGELGGEATTEVQQRILQLQLKDRTYTKSFFLTDDGHIGIGPRIARLEDVVCVFFGHRIPYLLRPTSDGRFLFLGPCYVHEMMHGQAIEGMNARKYKEDWIHLC